VWHKNNEIFSININNLMVTAFKIITVSILYTIAYAVIVLENSAENWFLLVNYLFLEIGKNHKGQDQVSKEDFKV